MSEDRQRLTTWQFTTEADLLAAGSGEGVEAGNIAYAIDTNKIYASVDPSSVPPVWVETTGAVPPTATPITNEVYTLDNIAVYADGQLPVPGPGASEGWHYDNNEIAAPAKINWYFYSSAQNPGVITLAELEGQYALVQVTTITDPIFLQVYTKPEGPGAVPPDAGSFYRSRITYIQPDPATSTPTPGIYLFHRADLDVTNIYPGYPRVACTLDGATTEGPQDPTEEVLLQSLGTNSGAAQGSLSFEASQTGYQTTSGRFNFALVANDYQPRLEVLRQGTSNYTLREYDKFTLEVGIEPTTTLVFPECTAQGAMFSIILPGGNPFTELVFDANVATGILGPNGTKVEVGGGSISYPPGTFAPGTVFTFTGRPSVPSLAQDGVWTLLSNTSPGSQTWAQTLARGEKTSGVSPVLQEPATGFSKADPRDQLHYHWSSTSQDPNPSLPPGGTVTPNAESTLAYTIPLYSENVPVDGGGSQIPVGIVYNGGDANVLVDVYAIANYGPFNGGDPTLNKYYHSRVWVDTRTQTITQFGPLEGDTAYFDLAVDPATGKITLAFNDLEPSASGEAIIRGVATVLAASLEEPL